MATIGRRGDGLRRSVRLFRSFLTEQSDPDGFYSTIADDTVELVRRHADLRGAVVLDVGGGPGYYSRAFRAAGARCVLVDADLRELAGRNVADVSQLTDRNAAESDSDPGVDPGVGAVVGDARRLPVPDGSADIAFSSNLLEHVDDPWGVADELARTVRPGGLLVVSYTVWLGPWGGHETSPWHYAGGGYAARRYERRTGRPPKNLFGTSMFATSAAAGLRWARSASGLGVVEVRPRYLPPAARRVLAVPGLREVVTWNLWMVLRKPAATVPGAAGRRW